MIIGQNFKQNVTTEKSLRDGYDKVYAEEIMKLDEDKFYNYIAKLAKKYSNNGSLLDISCGLGQLTNFSRELGFDAYGIDISNEAINKAKRNYPDCKFNIGNSERLPFENETFDIVTNMGSLEHYIDMEKAIKESARVLKKKGFALYMLPNQYFLPDFFKVFLLGDPNNKLQPIERFASKNEWKGLLENNGLKVVKILRYNQKFRGKGFLGFIYNVIEKIIPFNLSWHFIYICNRA